jgi:hypothetical protein
MTAARVGPYHRRVITEPVPRVLGSSPASRVPDVIGRFAPQAAGLTKRRAVDLCRVAGCLCPSS